MFSRFRDALATYPVRKMAPYSWAVLVALSIGAYLGRFDVENSNYILLSFLFALLIIPIASRILRGNLDVFEPFPFFVILYFLVFFLKSFFVVFYPEMFHYSEYVVPEFDSSTIRSTLSYLIIGILSFYAGYYLKIGAVLGNNFSTPLKGWHSLNVKIVVILFSIIAVFSTFVFMKIAGGIIYYITHIYIRGEIAREGGGYLLWGSLLGIEAVLLLYIFFLSRRIKTHVVFWAFALAIGGMYLVLGSRILFIYVFLGILVIHNFQVRRINLTHLILLSSILASVVLFVGFSRNLLGEGTQAIHEVIVRKVSDSENVLYTLFRLLNPDTINYDNFMIIISRVPHLLNYQYGLTYLHLLIYPIPRLLWHAKPSPIGTGIFTEVFFPGEYFAGVTKGITLPGELYLNFGILGISGGMFLFGIFLKRLDNYIRVNRSNPKAILFYATALVPLIAALRSGIFLYAQYLGMFWIPLFCSLRYVEQRSRHPTTV
jgi:oligosaccharide repeat unit polymerase